MALLKPFPLICTLLCYCFSVCSLLGHNSTQALFLLGPTHHSLPSGPVAISLDGGRKPEPNSYHPVKFDTFLPIGLISRVPEVRLHPCSQQTVTPFQSQCLWDSHLVSGSNILFQYQDHQFCFEPLSSWLESDSIKKIMPTSAQLASLSWTLGPPIRLVRRPMLIMLLRCPALCCNTAEAQL